MENQTRIRRSRHAAWALGALVVLTLAFIFGNSLQNGEASSEASGSLRQLLENLMGVPVNEFLLRKAAHFSEYALLGAEVSLLLRALSGCALRHTAWRRNVLDFAAFGFLTAAIDETIQIFSGRGSSLLDVWLDTAGYLTGFFLFFLLAQWILRIRSKRHEKL